MEKCFLFISMLFIIFSCKPKPITKENFLNAKINHNENSLKCAKEFSIHFDSVRLRLGIPIMPKQSILDRIIMDGISWSHSNKYDSTEIISTIFYDDLKQTFSYERTYIYI